MGWGGHEVQWRGDAVPQGTRQADIQVLYETRDWSQAAEILDRYQIEYVYIGQLEAATYLRLDESKFELFMDKVYETSGVRIYAREGGKTG